MSRAVDNAIAGFLSSEAWDAALPRRPDWDDYFFGIVEAVAKRADCRRKQVGAVLVAPDHRILSTGYNGAPAGVPGCLTAGACPRGQLSYAEAPPAASGGPSYDTPGSVCISDHAEWNAVMYARPESRAGATLYTTYPPCPRCAALIAAVGISDVRVQRGDV